MIGHFQGDVKTPEPVEPERVTRFTAESAGFLIPLVLQKLVGEGIISEANREGKQYQFRNSFFHPRYRNWLAATPAEGSVSLQVYNLINFWRERWLV